MSNAERDSNIIKAVLYKYASVGAYVFPLCWPEWNDSGHVRCGYGHLDDRGQPEQDNIGKAPLLSGGYRNATQTHAGIDDWLLKYPKANWGAYWPNQLVLDVDQDNGAYEDLARLVADIGELPQTLEQLSGGGGKHIVYLLPEGVNLKAAKLPGYERIHVKINGYIVVAGSIHKSGKPYSISHDSAIAEAPQALINLFSVKQEKHEVNTIDGIKSGSRHVDLMSLMGKLRHDGLAEDLIETLAQAANASADVPLAREEVTKMVHEYQHQTKSDTADGYIVIDKRGNPALDTTRLIVEIMAKTRFVFMLDNDSGFFYEGGVYRENAERFIAAECQRLVGINQLLSEHKILEIIGHIRRSNYHKRDEFNPGKNIINVKNGLLNVVTGELKSHTPDYLSNVQNPVTYDPSTDCPKIKKFLSEIHHAEDIPTVQEMYGYCLLRDNKLHKSFLQIGGGDNGKSTEQKLMETWLGPDNCAHKSWQQLEVNRFASSALEGKLVNMFADLPSKVIETTTTFKMLTSGDPIDAEKKFKDSYSFDNFAKLIFSTNKPPRITDEDSYAFWRRWIILKFPRQFTDKDKNLDMLAELTTANELSGMLNYALEGLKRLLSNNKFSYTKSVDEVTEFYLQASDPVYAFVNTKCELDSDATILKDTAYDAFKKYCEKNNIPVLKPNSFARSLQNQVSFHVRATKIMAEGKRLPAWQGIKLCQEDLEKPAETPEDVNGEQPKVPEESPKDPETVQDVRDGQDILYPNLARAGAGINKLKIGKNTDILDNLDSILSDCPACGRNEWEYTADGKLKCPCGHIREVDDGHHI